VGVAGQGELSEGGQPYLVRLLQSGLRVVLQLHLPLCRLPHGHYLRLSHQRHLHRQGVSPHYPLLSRLAFKKPHHTESAAHIPHNFAILL